VHDEVCPEATTVLQQVLLATIVPGVSSKPRLRECGLRPTHVNGSFFCQLHSPTRPNQAKLPLYPDPLPAVRSASPESGAARRWAWRPTAGGFPDAENPVQIANAPLRDRQPASNRLRSIDELSGCGTRAEVWSLTCLLGTAISTQERQTWEGAQLVDAEVEGDRRARPRCLVRRGSSSPPEFADRLPARSPRPTRTCCETAPWGSDMLPASGE